MTFSLENCSGAFGSLEVVDLNPEWPGAWIQATPPSP